MQPFKFLLPSESLKVVDLAHQTRLVSVLGFHLSNVRGFSGMTVLGTVTSRKNVGGSIERSIVGLFAEPISWFCGFHSYVVVAAMLVPFPLGLIRLLMFHTSRQQSGSTIESVPRP